MTTTHEAQLAELRREVSELGRRVEELTGALEQQVDGLTSAVERLYALLTEKPPGGGRRRVKVAPAQVGDLHKSKMYKARIARAARRYGLTLEDWLERFGPVDRLPPGVPRPAPTRPVEPYRRAPRAPT